MTEFVTIKHPDIEKRARVPRTAIKSLGEGWRIVGEPAAATAAAQGDFDPSEHTAAEVLDHLAVAGLDEKTRVLALEADGKARATVLAFTPNAEPGPTA